VLSLAHLQTALQTTGHYTVFMYKVAHLPMKKLSTKFIASAVIAAMMASAAAVSASAAVDYVVVPTYTPPTVTGGTDNGGDQGNKDNGGDIVDTNESTSSVIDDSIVNNAIKNGIAIQVTADDGDAIIQESAIGAIAQGDKPVTFDVADDESDFDYSVTIYPDEIDEIQAINIAMTITVTDKGIKIEPEQTGDFGMILHVTIPAVAFKDIDLDDAELFYVNSKSKVSLIADGLTVNDDGSVTIAISHASYYIISDIDLTSDIEGDIDIDDDDDDDTDVSIDDGNKGKDDAVVVNPGSGDNNPVTGTTLALGSLAVFAAAAVATSKKRK
jgi:hypothetical protein